MWGDLRDFLWAFGSDWLALMTGAASVILGGIGFFVGTSVSVGWWIAAYVCFIVAAFRIWQLEHQKPGPQINIEYQTRTQTPVDEHNYREWENFNASDGERELQFVLRNESPIAAYTVQVHAISLAGNTAVFEPVPMVVKGEPQAASITIEEFGPLRLHDFREFLSRGWQSLESLVVPVVVSYSDIHGRGFESHAEISYDRWVIRTVQKKYVPIRRRPLRWLARRN